MDVRFWGVRGSVAVSGAAYQRTGGNTTCVELAHEGWRLILDGGTGLAALGASLGVAPVRAAVAFTHVHWDHIQGVPFFSPIWHPDAELVLAGRADLRASLTAQMRPPTFPVPLEATRARIGWTALDSLKPWAYGPFTVTPLALDDHPDGVLVYRVAAGGRTVVFATDVEHGNELDPRLLRFAAGADLLVHDAQYRAAEYPMRRGWGHSTWEQAVDVADHAGCGRLALFHHDPTRGDAELDDIEAEAASRRPGTVIAREPVQLAV